MSKRLSRVNSISSPAKRLKLDVTRQPVEPKAKKTIQNVNTKAEQNHFNDVWGDDFGEEEIEEMDFIASQATQEEIVFVTPRPMTQSTFESARNSSINCLPSTSHGIKKLIQQKSFQRCNGFATIARSQMIGSSDINKEIFESTQAIKFDDFETDIKNNSLSSTFCNRQDVINSNVVLVSDDEQVEKWKEEKKKLLEDFMTKEGETEFLRQQLNQIQARAENAKKEQARLMDEQIEKYRTEINQLLKEKTSLESQLQLQGLQLNVTSEKCKLLESGSVKFTQPQVNMIISHKDRHNASTNWNSSKKIKTKENGVQVERNSSIEVLKTSFIQYPLKMIPQCIFQSPEPEKSVVDIKIDEKIGRRNLAIIQDEESYRIFENPELSKPKTTTVNNKTLSTQFMLPDIATLMNKTSDEINASDSIPILNKLLITTCELLLNSTLVLQNISQALQNDDVRDMNEIYLSEFYDTPVLHTKSFCEASAWYEIERGIETRRAVGILSYIALVSTYLADYVAGNIKLKLDKDPEYKIYEKQMKSYNEWYKKGFELEFLSLIMEFVTVIGTIRRSHQFTGLINAIMTLIANVQTTVGFSSLGLRQIYSIFQEIIYSRPILACFASISNALKEFSQYSSFVSKLCISPDKSGITYWKGSLNFTPDACILEIFIAQLDYFKLDPITLINVTKSLIEFSNTALLNNSIPWLEKTISSCNCCLNLLKFIMINLCECSKINIDELKNRYTKSNISYRNSELDMKNKEAKISLKNQPLEDWKNFELNHIIDFWDTLKSTQLSAIAYGIRLLSFLAKRDLDFMIRLTYIEDAFHIFLNNLNQRQDLKLKQSDEIALDIVKQTFVLEKNKEENKNIQQKIDIANIESENWTDITFTSQDLTELYEDSI